MLCFPPHSDTIPNAPKRTHHLLKRSFLRASGDIPALPNSPTAVTSGDCKTSPSTTILVDAPQSHHTTSYVYRIALIALLCALPLETHAGVLPSFTDKVKQVFAVNTPVEESDTKDTSQTMNLIKPVVMDEDATSAAATPSDGEESLKVVSGALRV